MSTVILDDDLMGKVVQIGKYKSPEEAVSAILFDYVQAHQSKQKLFDKLRLNIDMTDEEIDDLFKRDKDVGRAIDL